MTAADSEGQTVTFVDPVCGVDVELPSAPTSMLNGKWFRFCSDECRSCFEENPDRYLNPGPCDVNPQPGRYLKVDVTDESTLEIGGRARSER